VRRVGALADLQANHAAALADMQGTHERTLADTQETHERVLANTHGEAARQKAAAEAEHARELAAHKEEADATRTVIEGEREDLRRGLSGAREAIKRGESELASAVQTIADRNADLRNHAAAIAERDQRIAELRKEIEALEQENASYQDQVLRAYQKIKADEAMVSRARKAMAIALTVLDDDSGGTPRSS
jgi:chromosome segregation ATPase